MKSNSILMGDIEDDGVYQRVDFVLGVQRMRGKIKI